MMKQGIGTFLESLRTLKIHPEPLLFYRAINVETTHSVKLSLNSGDHTEWMNGWIEGWMDDVYKLFIK